MRLDPWKPILIGAVLAIVSVMFSSWLAQELVARAKSGTCLTCSKANVK